MSRKCSLLVALLPAIVLVLPLSTACAVGDADSGDNVIKAAGTLTVKDDCRILTDPNGRKFALLGKLDAANGEQIRITGKKAQPTKCFAGPAIQVEKLEKIKAGQDVKGGAEGEPQLKYVTKDATGSVANTPMEDGEVRRLRMRGLLNDEVKAKNCQGFRNMRGELWGLTGDLKSFKKGDDVRLEGLQSAAAECGIPTLKVTAIEAAPAQ
jgi:hypothetical protein